MSGRILVVDDVATNRTIMRAKLAASYYDVLLAEGGIEGLDIARTEMPDMILLDMIMPDMNGDLVCKELKRNPRTAHIPIVIMTADGSGDQRIRGLEAGADDFLTKPIDDLALFARVRNLIRVKMMFDELRLRDSTRRELGMADTGSLSAAALEADPVTLLVPPGPDFGQRWRQAIHSRFDTLAHIATSEADALDIARKLAPDACVIAQNINGGGDGLRLVSALRARPETRNIATILVVTDGGSQTATRALELGASDYVIAPFDCNELVARLRSQIRRKRYSEMLRNNLHDNLRLAVVDPLTGLFNRRYCLQHVPRIMSRAARNGATFSVLIMDLDRFKQVNDTYGHAAGDSVLREFANRLRENVRGIDLVARIGGEEFVVIMPDSTLATSRIVAERIRSAVEGASFDIGIGTGLDVTVSIGVALGDGHSRDIDALMREADEALYESKRAGRNMVSFHSTAA